MAFLARDNNHAVLRNASFENVFIYRPKQSIIQSARECGIILSIPAPAFKQVLQVFMHALEQREISGCQVV